MNSGESPLCPRCRQPMMDVSESMRWKDDSETWADYPDDGSDWDVSLGGAAEINKIWECPNCGQREYEA